jgi:hypothetical protein
MAETATGACRGCGRLRRLGTACTSVDCPTFVPIGRRVDAAYAVHVSPPAEDGGGDG